MHENNGQCEERKSKANLSPQTIKLLEDFYLFICCFFLKKREKDKTLTNFQKKSLQYFCEKIGIKEKRERKTA